MSPEEDRVGRPEPQRETTDDLDALLDRAAAPRSSRRSMRCPTASR